MGPYSRCGGGKRIANGTFKPPVLNESPVHVNLGFRPSVVLIYSSIYQRTTNNVRKITGVIDKIDYGKFTMVGQDSPVGST